MKTTAKTATLVFVISVLSTSSSAWGQTYAAATWSDNSIHLLDAGLNSISSFPSGASDPNGVTFSNGLIYATHFTSIEVVAFDLSGTEQFRWSNAALTNAQSTAWVNGELAISQNDDINFYNPLTGVITNTIPNPGGSAVEGMVYDGNDLWLLADSLLAINPVTGIVNATLPNAAAANGEDFDGTGIALGGVGELILAANDGDWYRVSTADGSVINAGNNTLDMYGLTNVVPEPGTLAIALVGLSLACFGRSRLVNV